MSGYRNCGGRKRVASKKEPLCIEFKAGNARFAKRGTVPKLCWNDGAIIHRLRRHFATDPTMWGTLPKGRRERLH